MVNFFQKFNERIWRSHHLLHILKKFQTHLRVKLYFYPSIKQLLNLLILFQRF